VGFQVSARVPGLGWGLLLLCGAACGEDEFHASAGPGIYTGPSFPGARHPRKLLFPFVDAEYAGRVYTSAEDLIGVYAFKTTDTQVGAALEYDPTERLSRDDTRLRGLPDVRETARFKLFGSRTVGAVTADANLAKDIAGSGQGILGQANLWLTVPFNPSFSVSAGPGVTWADSRYMHTLYAVTAAEAPVSVLPVFVAHAGIVDAHLNGLAEWVIHSKYRLGAQAFFGHLRGDAGASPITAQHGQTTVVGWIAYRFN
jgi:outer membrane protein